MLSSTSPSNPSSVLVLHFTVRVFEHAFFKPAAPAVGRFKPVQVLDDYHLVQQAPDRQLSGHGGRMGPAAKQRRRHVCGNDQKLLSEQIPDRPLDLFPCFRQGRPGEIHDRHGRERGVHSELARLMRRTICSLIQPASAHGGTDNHVEAGQANPP